MNAKIHDTFVVNKEHIQLLLRGQIKNQRDWNSLHHAISKIVTTVLDELDIPETPSGTIGTIALNSTLVKGSEQVRQIISEIMRLAVAARTLQESNYSLQGIVQQNQKDFDRYGQQLVEILSLRRNLENDKVPQALLKLEKLKRIQPRAKMFFSLLDKLGGFFGASCGFTDLRSKKKAILENQADQALSILKDKLTIDLVGLREVFDEYREQVENQVISLAASSKGDEKTIEVLENTVVDYFSKNSVPGGKRLWEFVLSPIYRADLVLDAYTNINRVLKGTAFDRVGEILSESEKKIVKPLQYLIEAIIKNGINPYLEYENLTVSGYRTESGEKIQLLKTAYDEKDNYEIIDPNKSKLLSEEPDSKARSDARIKIAKLLSTIPHSTYMDFNLIGLSRIDSVSKESKNAGSIKPIVCRCLKN